MERRSIIFLDLDCFEVQVWLNELRPDLIGKDVPIVVVNHDQRILSVNYTAKSFGVRRDDFVSLSDARSQCNQKGKNLIVIEAGDRFGKVDTFTPQVESDKILQVLLNFQASLGCHFSSIIIERSSRDEFYIDVTELIESYHKQNKNQRGDYFSTMSTFKIPSRMATVKLVKPRKQNLNDKYLGKPTTIMETCENEPIFGQELLEIVQEEGVRSIGDLEELILVHGAIIAQNMIEAIKKETGYEASAGIAHSKLVAKLACSRNKPQGIAIIANSSHVRLQKIIGFQDLPGFGGWIGTSIKEYYEKKCYRKITTIEDILWASKDGANFEYAFNELSIPNPFIRSAKLFNFCYFRDEDPVKSFLHPKTFRTSMAFDGDDSWKQFKDKIYGLYRDMKERIAYHSNEGRIAHELVVKAKIFDDVNAKVPKKLVNTINITGRGPYYRTVYSLIRDYCNENQWNHLNIYSISLIAKNIHVVKD